LQDRDFLFDEDGRRIKSPKSASAVGATSTPRTPAVTPPRRLPPISTISPRNQEFMGSKNRVMPVGGHTGIDPY
jgi:hypothetical protein